MTTAFQAWRNSGHTFNFGPHAIFFQQGGSGGAAPNLLCIHGLPTASWDFQRMWPSLTTSFGRVLVPDMLGFGWSDKPRAHSYSIFEQADLHEALLRAQGIQRYRILAHDYGVTVAQELLARHQERKARGDSSLVLEAVCLLNGGLFPESHRALLIQKLMLTRLGPLLSRSLNLRTFSHSFKKVFGPGTQPSETELAEFFQLSQHADGRKMFYKLFHYMPERRQHRERWVNALVRADLPVRLINGPADPVSGAHLVARYRELVPHPDVVVLDGIGHYPQVEAPEAVWQACKPILLG